MMDTNSEHKSSSRSHADADADAHAHSARKQWAWGFGHKVGKCIRGYLKGEAKVFQWTVRHGVPPSLCRLVFLTIKLLGLAAILYVSFWLAVYATVMWAFVKMAELGLIPDAMYVERNGWRSGHSGYGYYCGGCRIDDGVYDD